MSEPSKLLRAQEPNAMIKIQPSNQDLVYSPRNNRKHQETLISWFRNKLNLIKKSLLINTDWLGLPGNYLWRHLSISPVQNKEESGLASTRDLQRHGDREGQSSGHQCNWEVGQRSTAAQELIDTFEKEALAYAPGLDWLVHVLKSDRDFSNWQWRQCHVLEWHSTLQYDLDHCRTYFQLHGGQILLLFVM